MENDWIPSCLAIGSGNISFWGLLGSLCFFEKKGLLEDIDCYASSGNGCFFSIMLSLGMKLEEIREYISECHESIFYDSLSYQYLIYENENISYTNQFIDIQLFFTKIFEKITFNIPTLKQLNLITNKKLYLTTYDLREEKMIYLSYKTHPDMDILTAISLTTGVRHINCDIFYNGKLHIDASLCNPLPTSCFPRNKKILAVNNEWSSGLSFFYPKNSSGYSRLLMNISRKRLLESSYYFPQSKSLFINHSLGDAETLSNEKQLLEILENKESLCIQGYDMALKGLKMIKKAPKTIIIS